MQQSLWIEVSRSWIDAVVVRRSKVVHCHRHWRADENAPDHSLATDIEAALRNVTDKPGRVRVLWSAPGVPVDLRPMPVPGEPGRRAVRLAHAAAADLIPDIDALNITPISIAGPGTGEGNGQLALASGMHRELLEEIEAAVRSAGGTVSGVYASQASCLAETAESALAHPTERLSVSVSIGEDSSAIAIATEGRLALARTVDLGSAALRPSYEHVLRDAGRFDTAATTRSVGSIADEMVSTFGVPARAAEMPHGVSGDVVFQMMRPALQRLVFEVKQSIRFTALGEAQPENQRESKPTLRVVRTSIPNLSALIAHECDALDASAESDRSSGPGAGIREALKHPGALVPLLIPTSTATRKSTRMRLACSVGLAVALAAIGADAWSARNHALGLERETGDVQAKLDRVGAIDDASIHLCDASKEATAFLARTLAPVAPWAGCIATVAQELGPDVRITRVSGDRDSACSTLRFEGEAGADSPAKAREALLGAIERLRASELFGDVSVPNINQVSTPTGVVIEFTLFATLKEAPAPWLAEVTK